MKYTAIVPEIVPPVELPAGVLILQASWEDVLQAINLGAPHYIRHPSIVKRLGTEPSAGFFSPRIEDSYLTLRLKSSAASGETEVDVSPQQLEILSVEIFPVE